MERCVRIHKIVALAIVAVSTGANAGMYQACANTANQVPCGNSAWDFGVEALYLKNNSNALNGDLSTVSTKISFPTLGNNINWNPTFGWGYRLEGSYHFNAGNDISVNWSHYKSTYTFKDVDGYIFTKNDSYRIVSRFDVVNIELGQRLEFGESLAIRGHLGVQYANFKENWSSDIFLHGTFSDYDVNKVTGWGPRLGLDVNYEVVNGFGLYTKTGAGLISVKKDYHTFVPAGETLQELNISTHPLIPEFDLAMGAAYTRAFAQGDLTAKVAWNTLIYLNSTYNEAATSWSGVSFGLKWVGNA